MLFATCWAPRLRSGNILKSLTSHDVSRPGMGVPISRVSPGNSISSNNRYMTLDRRSSTKTVRCWGLIFGEINKYFCASLQSRTTIKVNHFTVERLTWLVFFFFLIPYCNVFHLKLSVFELLKTRYEPHTLSPFPFPSPPLRFPPSLLRNYLHPQSSPQHFPGCSYVKEYMYPKLSKIFIFFHCFLFQG